MYHFVLYVVCCVSCACRLGLLDVCFWVVALGGIPGQGVVYRGRDPVDRSRDRDHDGYCTCTRKKVISDWDNRAIDCDPIADGNSQFPPPALRCLTAHALLHPVSLFRPDCDSMVYYDTVDDFRVGLSILFLSGKKMVEGGATSPARLECQMS